MVSLYSSDLRVAAMLQEMQQCTSKAREEQDCQLQNVDLKKKSRTLKYWFCKCFIRKEAKPTYLLDLSDPAQSILVSAYLLWQYLFFNQCVSDISPLCLTPSWQ